jgi:isochorismate synthase
MLASPLQWVAFTSPVDRLEPWAPTEFGKPAFLWENSRAGQSCAGFGITFSVDSDAAEQAFEVFDRVSKPGQFLWFGEPACPRPSGPWFGGMAFDPSRHRGEWWSGFSAGRWVLPRLLLWSQRKRPYLTGFRPVTEGVDSALASLREEVRERASQLNGQRTRPNGIPRLRKRFLNGAGSDRLEWGRLLQSALDAIRSGALEKVVIARSVDIEAPQPFDPEQVFRTLRRIAPGSAVFLIRGTDDTAFVGASPELLCRCDGSLVETEALAGSASHANAAGLLQSDKENREHRSVVDGIREALGPYSEAVSVDGAPTLLGVPHLVHLRTPIRARLKNGSRISQVLAALHPTPAVGGSPKQRALSFLAEHENLDRGWYGGALGWIGEGSMELMVALRSAVVRANRARLFVGAGIVEGSTEEGEWEETEAKGLTIREALAGGGPDAFA